MEFCPGGDLGQALRAREKAGAPLSEDEAMLSFVQVCLALDYIHTQGFLHRDVKASNVFISSSGALKLGDFGIAKVLGASECTRTFVGTPFYLSPELLQDESYGHKSDVWAAGCLLYELCALRRPFHGQSIPAVCIKVHFLFTYIKGKIRIYKWSIPMNTVLEPPLQLIINWRRY